jgi:predicted  nucleic acid-binding Zn-ribbon protein
MENEKRINEYAAIANKAKEEFNVNKAEYDKVLQQAKPEIDRLKGVRDALQAKVDSTLLNKYLNMRKNKIVPTAPLQNSRCGGCHMEMPAFTVSSATKNGFCECENCGRIVYIE